MYREPFESHFHGARLICLSRLSSPAFICRRCYWLDESSFFILVHLKYRDGQTCDIPIIERGKAYYAAIPETSRILVA